MKAKDKFKKGLTKAPSSKLVGDTADAIKLFKGVENLTVEDVVVLYAYAEAIVETVREPLIILDGSLRIKTANKSFFDTFKVTKEKTYNRHIFELGNGQWDIPQLRNLLKKILQKNSQFNDYQVTHSFEDIGERTMLLNARRIVLEGHRTELILLAIEDITEKKLLDKQKDDFIAFASHELKTPLTSVKVYIEILLSSNLESNNKKNEFILEKIAKQVGRMEGIMSSFLNAYFVQTGKMELHKSRFSIDDLIADIVKTFQYTTTSHNITHKNKSVKKVFADRERIEEVLINLLTNAIKYSPKGGEVIFKTEDNDKSVTVSVQDFGPGIPAEQQSLIFSRFFRSDSKTAKKVPGLGLGLYIAHQIVKEHKGRMWVKSQKKTGSIFYFTLPTSPN